jgi:hypothetical protein
MRRQRQCRPSQRQYTARALACVLLGTVPRATQAQEDSTSSANGVLAFLSAPQRAAWARPLASAVAPGLGQLLGGQDRGAIYLVTETYLIARFVSDQREARREADRFRDLAFQVARRSFGPGVRDTAFGYFEKMAEFVESGPFDTDPGAPLVPPTDERSFNGHIWRLARETFFQNPDSLPSPDAEEYQRALEFYRRRAVGPNFLWSWRGALLEQDLFRQTIRASDEAFRAATQHLGALLVNHLLSVIDAWVTHRLSGDRRAGALSGDAFAGRDARGQPRLVVQVRAVF